MALVQATTKSPVASEAVATAGGAKAPATGLVFTTNSGASGVWLSSRRSSSASTLGRLRKIGRGGQLFIRLRDSEENMNFSEGSFGERSHTQLACGYARPFRESVPKEMVSGILSRSAEVESKNQSTQHSNVSFSPIRY